MAVFKKKLIQEGNILRKMAVYFALAGFCLFWLVRFEPAPCDFLLGLASIVWFADWVIHRRGLGLELPDWFLLGFVLVNLAGLTFTPILGNSFRFVMITIYLAILYIFLRQAFDDKSLRQTVIKLYIGCTILTGILIWIATIGLTIWRDPAKLSLLLNNVQLGFFTPSAFFKDPNVAGSFMAPAASYFAWRIIKEGLSAIRIMLFCFLTGSIFLTFSRGAVLSLAICCLILFWVTSAPRRRKLGLLFTSAVLVLVLPLALVFNPITDEWASKVFPHLPLIRRVITDGLNPASQVSTNDAENTSSGSLINRLLADYPSLIQYYDSGGRYYAWLAGTKVFLESPVLGSGPGSFEYYSPALEKELGAEKIVPSAHNLYIRVLAENGSVGFIFLTCFVIYSWRSARFPQDNFWIKSALIGVLVNAFFIDTLHHRHLWLLLALL